MKPNRFQKIYTVTTAVFVGIACGGMMFLDWGEVRLAFLLLIYCLLLLAYRLDEVVRQLASIDGRLAQLATRPAVFEPRETARSAGPPPSSYEGP